MKSNEIKRLELDALSLPVRGAWIEIKNRVSEMERPRSLPVRGAWIEISSIRAGESP